MIGRSRALPKVMTKKRDTTEIRGISPQEYEDQHYGILIESLLAQGSSEDEIVQAVEEARAAERRAA